MKLLIILKVIGQHLSLMHNLIVNIKKAVILRSQLLLIYFTFNGELHFCY